MKAYHFLKSDMTSGEGREPPWQVRETRKIKGELELCRCGYHSSPSWYDALSYAPGSIACIVEVSTPIEKDGTKQVSRQRTLVACADAEKTLRYWACDCAERALKKAGVTDERSWNAIKVARDYNEGKATKEELTAARAAAWDAVWAAWASAGNARAARAAARDARAAAWDAVWAAWASAGDVAWGTEVRWQTRRLNWYMEKLFKEATQ